MAPFTHLALAVLLVAHAASISLPAQTVTLTFDLLRDGATVQDLLADAGVSVPCDAEGKRITDLGKKVAEQWPGQREIEMRIKHVHYYKEGATGTVVVCLDRAGNFQAEDVLAALALPSGQDGYEVKDFAQAKDRNQQATPLYIVRRGGEWRQVPDLFGHVHYVPLAGDTVKAVRGQLWALGKLLNHPVLQCQECIQMCRGGKRVGEDATLPPDLEPVAHSLVNDVQGARIVQVCDDEAYADLKARLYGPQWTVERHDTLECSIIKPEHKMHHQSDPDIRPINLVDRPSKQFIYEIFSRPPGSPLSSARTRRSGVCEHAKPLPSFATIEQDLQLADMFYGAAGAFVDYRRADAMAWCDKKGCESADLRPDRPGEHKLRIENIAVMLNVHETGKEHVVLQLPFYKCPHSTIDQLRLRVLRSLDLDVASGIKVDGQDLAILQDAKAFDQAEVKLEIDIVKMTRDVEAKSVTRGA